MIAIDLHNFLTLSFQLQRCSFEQNTRKLIVYLENFSDNNNFIFVFFIVEVIFLGAMFKCYHFQAGHNTDIIKDTLFIGKIDRGAPPKDLSQDLSIILLCVINVNQAADCDLFLYTAGLQGLLVSINYQPFFCFTFRGGSRDFEKEGCSKSATMVGR